MLGNINERLTLRSSDGQNQTTGAPSSIQICQVSDC
jgi:hypothetical protein